MLSLKAIYLVFYLINAVLLFVFVVGLWRKVVPVKTEARKRTKITIDRLLSQESTPALRILESILGKTQWILDLCYPGWEEGHRRRPICVPQSSRQKAR
uniref:Uncharacterized protein n=1 Tax=Plectus sambesii TaxID=2011161 RepID=A0A914VHL3_9BILA